MTFKPVSSVQGLDQRDDVNVGKKVKERQRRRDKEISRQTKKKPRER